MTTTTTETTRRAYVRRIGYAAVLEVHSDHSATVRFEDDRSEERIPFGDWVYADHPDLETAVDVKARIGSVLRRDLGESFAVTNSGVGPGDASWLRAGYGPYVVEVTVKHAP